MKDLGYLGCCAGIGFLLAIIYERGKLVGKVELAEKTAEGLKGIAEGLTGDNSVLVDIKEVAD